MLTLYHNPRCRKSREAVLYLETNNYAFKIVRYLDESPFTVDSLSTLLKKINCTSFELVRKNEPEWKSIVNKKELTETEVLQLLVNHPKLIERPIVEGGKTGVLARPLENLINYLESR